MLVFGSAEKVVKPDSDSKALTHRPSAFAHGPWGCGADGVARVRVWGDEGSTGGRRHCALRIPGMGGKELLTSILQDAQKRLMVSVLSVIVPSVSFTHQNEAVSRAEVQPVECSLTHLEAEAGSQLEPPPSR